LLQEENILLQGIENIKQGLACVLKTKKMFKSLSFEWDP